MKLSKRQLKKIIREEYSRLQRRGLIKESLHSHMDGNITNIILHASQKIGEEYGDITVDDVVQRLHGMSDQEILDHSDPMSYDTMEYGEYLVSTIRQIDYETVVDRMWELVEIGELADGYEDFFSLPGVQ